jgi:hypothetical protein
MLCSEQGLEEKNSKPVPTFLLVTFPRRNHHLPRVGYLNLTTGLMATTPFPGVTNSQTLHLLAAHCVVLFFLPLWRGFDQSLFSSHCRSQTSFFPCAHQPGVDIPSSTTRRPPLLSTTLRSFTSPSHLHSLATVTKCFLLAGVRHSSSLVVPVDELTPLVRCIHWPEYRSHSLHCRMLACPRKQHCDHSPGCRGRQYAY